MVLFLSLLGILTHIPQKSIPSFCRTISWHINMLSVRYILSEVRLEMNREAVIETGLSGLIPMDLEA